ncbi:hypothetical protein [Acidimangrovimonas sediminis]|uniref:hypothetical protein n=1 Tax=Acidimangrovimonas sediminis TaxID=2056283 RepID=UPI000C8071B9|nr:hypothetical protein [Acidimangrovimonas sediminis]
MSQIVSLNARNANDAASTAETEVALFVIEHPSLDAPLRLATDWSERISDEPLMYGLRSTWQGADPATDPYLFVLASAEVPGDLEDGPGPATIVLENVDNDIIAVLRSITDRATVHMAVVLASSPDLVELEFLGLKLISADYDAAQITLSISRQPIEDEAVPSARFTKDRFPGLFK